MSANQIADSLIEAMENMFDNNKETTYECTVIKCVNSATGEHELDYRSNKITAYSISSSTVYSPDELVYVIAPSGDFNDIKYILGPVNPREGEEPPPESDGDDVVNITDDLLDLDTEEDVFGLKSYESINYKDITDKLCQTVRFNEILSKYLNGTRQRVLRLAVDIKTELDNEQIYSDGDYWISIELPFIDKSLQQYKLNTTKMIGSPKSFLDWAHQILEIVIPDDYIYDTNRNPIVSIGKENFIENEDKIPEDYDIKFKNISFHVVSKLSAEEYNDYYVHLFASGGEYFLREDSVDAKKTISAALLYRGEALDITEDEIYWFEADSKITPTSNYYLEIAGSGWKCLNPKTEEGSFEPHVETIEVKSKDIDGNKRFKCVIVRDKISYSGQIDIFKDMRDFEILLNPTDGLTTNISVFDKKVVLELKFYYKGLTNNLNYASKVSYVWSKENRAGEIDESFPQFMRTVSQNKEIRKENDKYYYITKIEFPSDLIDRYAIIKAEAHIQGIIEGFEDFNENKDYYIDTAAVALTIVDEDYTDAIPKLLYDYNTRELIVGQSPTMIASISCNVVETTAVNEIDIEGHLLVHLNSTEYCNAIIRFFDSGIQELYSPLTFNIHPGRNTIGVPHSYLNRAKGSHDFIVTCQCTNGLLDIETRGVLFTIDTGYLAARLLDAGMDVRDISFKHTLNSTAEPDELWAVGIDKATITVKKRKYGMNEKTRWVVLPYEIEDSVMAAAIEFNGFFESPANIEAENYTLTTEDEPYLFWVTTEGELYYQIGGDAETRGLIDSGVSSISACRGYNSTEFLEQDQGLVVLYIKDNKAYYKNYCYTENGYIWEGPFAIDLDEIIIDAKVSRLNDYRLCFSITTEDNNYLYITKRTYVGQGSKPEYFMANHTDSIINIAILPVDYIEDFKVEAEVSEDDDKLIILTFSYPVEFRRDPVLTDFNISGKVPIAIKQIEENKIGFTFKDEVKSGGVLDYKQSNISFCYIPNKYGYKAISDFSCTIPGYNYQETFDVTIVETNINIGIRGIETIRSASEEIFDTNIDETLINISLDTIKSIRYDAPSEYFSVTQEETEMDIAIQYVGESPV